MESCVNVEVHYGRPDKATVTPYRVQGSNVEDRGEAIVLKFSGFARKMLLTFSSLSETEEMLAQLTTRCIRFSWLRPFLPTWEEIRALRSGQTSILPYFPPQELQEDEDSVIPDPHATVLHLTGGSRHHLRGTRPCESRSQMSYREWF